MKQSNVFIIQNTIVLNKKFYFITFLEGKSWNAADKRRLSLSVADITAVNNSSHIANSSSIPANEELLSSSSVCSDFDTEAADPPLLP